MFSNTQSLAMTKINDIYLDNQQSLLKAIAKEYSLDYQDIMNKFFGEKEGARVFNKAVVKKKKKSFVVDSVKDNRIKADTQAAKDVKKEEQERIKSEKKKAAKDAEKEEKERIKSEKKAAKDAEKAEKERIKSEKKAAKDAEKEEQERIKSEKKAAKDAEKEEKERIKSEKKAAKDAEKAEQERIKSEKKAAKDAEKEENKEVVKTSIIPAVGVCGKCVARVWGKEFPQCTRKCKEISQDGKSCDRFCKTHFKFWLKGGDEGLPHGVVSKFVDVLESPKNDTKDLCKKIAENLNEEVVKEKVLPVAPKKRGRPKKSKKKEKKQVVTQELEEEPVEEKVADNSNNVNHDEEEELSCKEFEENGLVYLLDPKSNKIYQRNGENNFVGKLVAGSINFDEVDSDADSE
jgi:phage-related minor tail protein